MAEEMKERREQIDLRRKRNVVEAAQRSCEAMKSSFEMEMESIGHRQEMRTLETRDDFDFKVLFDPSEGENLVPDIRRIPKPNQGSTTPAELVDTKEMNRAFL